MWLELRPARAMACLRSAALGARRMPSASVPRLWRPCQRQQFSSQDTTPPSRAPSPPKEVTVEGKTYKTDEWMNTPPSILAAIPRRLHLQPNHPIAITRQIIESRFPDYEKHNELFPIVSTAQNFDSLDFPPDHPGRARSDTYYLNAHTVLRTHTSAHQADTFRANTSPGYLISADVYRRDAVDRSHYPVFHQMEGARTWDKRALGADLVPTIHADLARIPHHAIKVDDPNPPFHPTRNPLQTDAHTPAEAAAIAAHLKRTLEDVVVAIFHAARAASGSDTTTTTTTTEPLKVRWVEAYFPFTSPSWELEVFWQGDWLEILGCGVVRQSILDRAGVPGRVGWAFGLGLERIAMLLFGIPDIRLFWSTDPRFLSQFRNDAPPTRFVPFSKYPACYKDVAFWLPQSNPNTTSTSTSTSSNAAAAGDTIHDNDVMELVREVVGDVAEDVRRTDAFVHPRTGRASRCYRVHYRSLERTLTNDEANRLHDRLRARLVERFGVELR